MKTLDEATIGVIGLGYVGLPIAVSFGKQFTTLGFDINAKRVSALRAGQDDNLELGQAALAEAAKLRFTNLEDELAPCSIYIVTVPTPIDKHRRPDLSCLIDASHMLGRQLAPGNIVIFESTVYPGAVEEICAPALAASSGLTYNKDFFLGYSPERINPGDKCHTLENIVKITSGSTPEVAALVDQLYGTIVQAGTHPVSSIKVAEAAKVIENTQRDLNIALVNELAIIFNKLQLDTEEVLDAAATKWNFIRFTPGLVGGHCIGVDPYYLTHKAQEIGYLPEVILAGRRINDEMGKYVAGQLIKKMLEQQIHIKGSRILILGFAFKEDCSDCRNTKVLDIILELAEYGVQVEVFDPCIETEVVATAYAAHPFTLLDSLPAHKFDAVVVAVAHAAFREMGITAIRQFGKPKHVVFDVKRVLPKQTADVYL